MDRPLEIVFHNMKASAELEALVRERVERLQRLYPHIIGCRTSIELKNRAHRSGNLPEVHVEVQIPGQILVANHESHRAKDQPDALSNIRDVFDAMTIQLKDHKERQRAKERPARNIRGDR